MLSDTLRDGANSKGFKILLALIVISFIISGVGGYLIPRLNTDPVTIGEYKITSNEWTEQYNRRAQQLHQYGPQAAQLLENQAYVRAELCSQQARKLYPSKKKGRSQGVRLALRAAACASVMPKYVMSSAIPQPSKRMASLTMTCT